MIYLQLAHEMIFLNNNKVSHRQLVTFSLSFYIFHSSILNAAKIWDSKLVCFYLDLLNASTFLGVKTFAPRTNSINQWLSSLKRQASISTYLLSPFLNIL